MSQLEAKGEPIMIPCEGSGWPPNLLFVNEATNQAIGGLCAMCGKAATFRDHEGNLSDHERDDTIARLERGDFA